MTRSVGLLLSLTEKRKGFQSLIVSVYIFIESLIAVDKHGRKTQSDSSNTISVHTDKLPTAGRAEERNDHTMMMPVCHASSGCLLCCCYSHRFIRLQKKSVELPVVNKKLNKDKFPFGFFAFSFLLLLSSTVCVCVVGPILIVCLLSFFNILLKLPWSDEMARARRERCDDVCRFTRC